MGPIEVFAGFYSPRWGHNDEYKFVFSMDRLEIAHGARKCAAIYYQDSDPTWEGTRLISTFVNDHIRPPHGVEDLLIRLWSEWRTGRFTPGQLQDELTAFADYVNASTHAKPKTTFWREIF